MPADSISKIREARVLNGKHPDVDAFEERGRDITSVRKISVATQIQRVNQAMSAAA